MAKRISIIPLLQKPFAKRGLYEHFQRISHSFGLKKEEKIVLGLSGGRDSVALLHLLLIRGHSVIAAHLNHSLRGKESDEDERFVSQLCKAWNVPLITAREKVANLAKRYQLSTEAAARIARYRFLQNVAQRQKARKVVVAHHQNDQAETILLKFFQGCSRKNLTGMKMKRPFPLLNWKASSQAKIRSHLHLIRPLLQVPHFKVIRYIQQNKLPFREDSSNRDLSHSRNWIRHHLFPLIEQHLHRNIVKTLARWGED